MRPLRIVMLLIEPPVPFGIAAGRWYYVLLRELVARGHRVTCFAACSKPSEMDEARALFPAPGYDLRLYPFPTRRGLGAKFETLRRPYSYMFSAELLRDLKAELARGFDVLHLEQLWCGWLGLAHRERALVNVHYLFSVDQAGAPIHGLGSRIRWWLSLRGERRLLHAYPRLTALSNRLRDEILRIAPRANVSVCPLGIDPALYAYIPDEQRTRQPVVSLIGNMSWYPTHSAATRLLTRLWPEIKRRVIPLDNKCGSISARAEEPRIAVAARARIGVDLRAGGGALLPLNPAILTRGRSPRERRSRWRAGAEREGRGSISARAEEPHPASA